jgi:large subunit ribosomal protein L15
MDISSVHKIPILRKKRWRVGRGESSGSGKTCGRGTKGQKSRSGASFKPYFEGGQMPLIRRIPKRGFSNIRFKRSFNIINVGLLNEVFEDGEVVDLEMLHQRGIVKRSLDGLKILGDGELKKRLLVRANKFSKSALQKIHDAGGSTELLK